MIDARKRSYIKKLKAQGFTTRKIAEQTGLTLSEVSSALSTAKPRCIRSESHREAALHMLRMGFDAAVVYANFGEVADV